VKEKDFLINQIQELPDYLIQEVGDFVEFLKTKWKEEKLEVLKTSESSLSKDWLKAEEDEAWAHL
jgi:hypothetical protein